MIIEDNLTKNLPEGVFIRDIIVCLLAAGGFLLFWEFQYLEAKVMKSKIQKAQEEYFLNLSRYLDLIEISNEPKVVDNVMGKLRDMPAINDTIPLEQWLKKIKIYSQELKIIGDTTFIQQLTNRLEQLTKTTDRNEKSIGKSYFFWWTGIIFSFTFGLVMLIIILSLQRIKKQDVKDGRTFCYPIPLVGVFAPFIVLTFLMLLFVWGREITDVYWVWLFPYGAVLAAFAGARDEPIWHSDRARVVSTLSRSRSSLRAQRYISWLKSKIDQERQITQWVLIVAFALGFTLFFGALQSTADKVTPEGMHYIAIEYVSLSVYIWSVGIFGIFFRYLSRVKVLQKILLAP